MITYILNKTTILLLEYKFPLKESSVGTTPSCPKRLGNIYDLHRYGILKRSSILEQRHHWASFRNVIVYLPLLAIGLSPLAVS
jgi:hypothetical protein